MLQQMRSDEERIEQCAGGQSNWATDAEILHELASEVVGIGDVRYGSVFCDPTEGRITATLQDGRFMVIDVQML